MSIVDAPSDVGATDASVDAGPDAATMCDPNGTSRCGSCSADEYCCYLEGSSFACGVASNPNCEVQVCDSDADCDGSLFGGHCCSAGPGSGLPIIGFPNGVGFCATGCGSLQECFGPSDAGGDAADSSAMDAPSDVSSTDATSDATSGADASDASIFDAPYEAGMEAGGACNALTNSAAPAVTVSNATGSLPTAVGGTIQSGTYVLSGVAWYGTGATGQYQATASITTGTTQTVESTPLAAGTQTYSLHLIENGTHLTAGLVCSSSSSPSSLFYPGAPNGYSATATTLDVIVTGISAGTGWDFTWTIQ